MDDLDLWPLPGLRVACAHPDLGDLELRYPDDRLLLDLARLAGEGVHPADRMPFGSSWALGEPRDVALSLLRQQWKLRARSVRDEWALELGLVRVRDGGTEILGMQGLRAEEFPVKREVRSSSWLGLRHQGQGLGTLMRRMVLHLAFEGLGAETAMSVAFADTEASNAVSRKLGYRLDGTDVSVRQGRRILDNRYRMTREEWAADPARPEVTMSGVGPVRELLGLTP